MNRIVELGVDGGAGGEQLQVRNGALRASFVDIGDSRELLEPGEARAIRLPAGQVVVRLGAGVELAE